MLERPIAGVTHSLLQGDARCDPQTRKAGGPLASDLPLRCERTAGRAVLWRVV